MADRESEWSAWMRAANQGDEQAYRRVLSAMTVVIRTIARRGYASNGLSAADAEDVVQETLLAIHLKRHTWDESKPVTPWVRAITRNKIVDSLRRRGGRIHMPIEDFIEILPAEEQAPTLSTETATRLLDAIDGRPRDVVQAISIDGRSVREVASQYGISEGAVRVALHRGLAALSAAYKDTEL